MYAFLGDIRSDVTDERREVACFRVSLSVQDLLSVGGASGRDGLQRTAPRREKFERPRSVPVPSSEIPDPIEVVEMVGGALVHGVASSWASMVSSMLASPHGASEQYIWICTSSQIVKGCGSCSVLSPTGRWRTMFEPKFGEFDTSRHSSNKKRLNVRIATTSACQSWRMLPAATRSLFWGRHFMPVLREISALSPRRRNGTRRNISFQAHCQK